LLRDDRTILDALGRALSGAACFWCAPQPAVTTTFPPSPLAPVFTDTTGDTPITQPVLSDGFGAAHVYIDDGSLFTFVVFHPLFGPNPIVLPDQSLGSGGGGGGSVAVFSGVPSGTIDGTNKTFTVLNGSTPLTAIPAQITAWLNFPLIEGLGYSLAVVDGQLQITYANAPQPASGGNPADAIFAQGIMAT
jgi:hypothetical protein